VYAVTGWIKHAASATKLYDSKGVLDDVFPQVQICLISAKDNLLLVIRAAALTIHPVS
jgi:hypothetical protein